MGQGYTGPNHETHISSDGQSLISGSIKLCVVHENLHSGGTASQPRHNENGAGSLASTPVAARHGVAVPTTFDFPPNIFQLHFELQFPIHSRIILSISPEVVLLDEKYPGFVDHCNDGR
ncbi:hypothetical protein Fot_28692 [Forsythia ovata]|uniref:Uncharacterized protein n=1 Tax=Forsythia ovata TaxID=205694 RepID=A0ABD1TPR3_9LAMI